MKTPKLPKYVRPVLVGLALGLTVFFVFDRLPNNVRLAADGGLLVVFNVVLIFAWIQLRKTGKVIKEAMQEQEATRKQIAKLEAMAQSGDAVIIQVAPQTKQWKN